MVGKKRSKNHVTSNVEDNLSVPPGFVSLTSMTLKKIASGVDKEHEPGLVGGPLSNSDIERFKTSLIHRPWISHGQFECVQHQDESDQIGVYMRDPVGGHLPKGVIRGCADCHECVKVTARSRREYSYLPVLDDAPVFRPTDEEFKETLKYLADIRPRAENYGICRIVPPPSWKPPLLLKKKKIWEDSKFSTHVQKIDGLRNQFFKRKRSRLDEKIETETTNDAACVKFESYNEDVGDSEEAKAIDLVSEFDRGPAFTLKSFKKYADDFKAQYFRENDKEITVGQNQREPLIARVESEYWRIVENPTEEIEVLFGTDLAHQTLPSGFPVDAGREHKDKYINYLKSGWNLNNTPHLYGSLLRYGCDNSSEISASQMFVGMCFASQCWRIEDHHLYSLSYVHMGGPKVWYCIPGEYRFKFVELLKKRFPQLAKHPRLLHELVAQLPPPMLMSEGIPVYRCVQNTSEFVVTFPGAYHSEFSCGFNFSEAVCCAPLDWLPHGHNIVEVYAGYRFPTSLSHDKLLLGAAMEAVDKLWDSFANKSDSSQIRLWRSVWGKGGTLTRLLKLRVESEGRRRKHLFNMLSKSSKLDELDATLKRECSVCLCDLYFSAMACSCSPNRFSCLLHAKKFCSCPWSAKQLLYRYEIADLNLLVEALEENLKAVHSWAKRKHRLMVKGKQNDSNELSSSSKSLAGANEERGSTSLNNVVDQSASGRKIIPDDNVVRLLSSDDEA